MTIKAIETQYKGYRFRSRLEARWAVFFDALGVAWEYEKEGFEMDGVRYLPDFHLPESLLWVEIKPDKPSDDELQKLVAFTKHTKDNFLMLIGQPYLGEGDSAYRCEYAGLFLRATESGTASRPQLITGLAYCGKCIALWWVSAATESFAAGPIGSCCEPGVLLSFPLGAYAKARSARFEHGETPCIAAPPVLDTEIKAYAKRFSIPESQARKELILGRNAK